MDESNGVKLLAFPRETLEAPVVMTSWGRKQVVEAFDPDLARTFVKRNLNRPQSPSRAASPSGTESHIHPVYPA